MITFKQIAIAAETDSGNPIVFGLDEDGRVWKFSAAIKKWKALSMEVS